MEEKGRKGRMERDDKGWDREKKRQNEINGDVGR